MQHEDPFPTKRHAYRERSDVGERAEMEVVKAILLREEYIERIKANLTSQGSKFGKDQGAFEDLLGLIDLLRLATVDTCEAIQQWREVQESPSMPFVWKDMNYLLRMPIDLNFLDEHKVKMAGLSLNWQPPSTVSRVVQIVPTILIQFACHLAGRPYITTKRTTGLVALVCKSFSFVYESKRGTLLRSQESNARTVQRRTHFCRGRFVVGLMV